MKDRIHPPAESLAANLPGPCTEGLSSANLQDLQALVSPERLSSGPRSTAPPPLALPAATGWSFRRFILEHGPVFLLLTALWAALYLPRPGRVWLEGDWRSDSVNNFFSQSQFAARQLARTGRLPLWNPYNGFGQPFLANPQTALLSPLTWPHFFLPPETATLLAAWLRFLLGGWFAFLYFRKIGLRRPTALTGACAYALLPHLLAWSTFPQGVSEIYIPLALFWAEDYLRRPRAAAVVGLALTLTAQLFAGQVQTWAVTAGFTALYFGWQAVPRRLGWKRSMAFLTFLPLNAILAAPQLFPFLEYLQHSAGFVIRSILNPSLGFPRDMVTLWLPNFFGDASGQGFWGPVAPRDCLMYAGLPVLLLALVSFQNPKNRRDTVFFGGIFVFYWLVTFRWPAFLADAFLGLPFLGTIGFNKYFIFIDLCLLIPAAKALDRFAWPEDGRRCLRAAGLLAGLSLVAWLTHADFIAQFEGSKTGEMAIFAGLLLLTLAALRFAGQGGRLRRLAGIGALLGLIAGDLGCIDRHFVHSVAHSDLVPGLDNLPRELRGHRRWLLPGMPPEVNLLYGLRSVGSYDAMSPDRYWRLAAQADVAMRTAFARLSEPTEEETSRIDAGTLRRRWIKAVFQASGPERLARLRRTPGLGPLSRLDTSDWAGLFGVSGTVETPAAGPSPPGKPAPSGEWRFTLFPPPGQRAALSYTFQTAGSDQAAFDLVRADPGRARHEPILTALPGLPLPALPQPGLTGCRGESSDLAVRWLQDEPEQVVLQVQTEKPAWLVLRDLYYPGWEAALDGGEAPIYPANYAFRAVRVPAGRHTVRFTYTPAPFRLGCWAAAAGFLAAVVCLFASRIRRVRQRPPATCPEAATRIK